MLELHEIREILNEREFKFGRLDFESEESRKFVSDIGYEGNIEPLYDEASDLRMDLWNWLVFRLTERRMMWDDIWDSNQQEYLGSWTSADKAENQVRYFKVRCELLYDDVDSWYNVREPILMSKEDAEEFIRAKKQEDEQFTRQFYEDMSTDEEVDYR